MTRMLCAIVACALILSVTANADCRFQIQVNGNVVDASNGYSVEGARVNWELPCECMPPLVCLPKIIPTTDTLGSFHFLTRPCYAESGIFPTVTLEVTVGKAGYYRKTLQRSVYIVMPCLGSDSLRFVIRFPIVQLEPIPTSVENREEQGATRFEVLQNYPNPFNPTTSIDFSVQRAGHVAITVYNVLGQEIAKIIDGVYSPGSYTAAWNSTDDNGSPVASGLYFYRMKTGEFVQTRKMVLLK